MSGNARAAVARAGSEWRPDDGVPRADSRNPCGWFYQHTAHRQVPSADKGVCAMVRAMRKRLLVLAILALACGPKTGPGPTGPGSPRVSRPAPEMEPDVELGKKID